MTIKEEKLNSLHKIRVDGNTVKKKLERTIDQIILLSKSALWGYTIGVVNDIMKKYHELPEEQQIKILPAEIKYVLQEEYLNLKKSADNYAKYRKNPRPAMRMNDEDDKTTTVIDSDFLDIEFEEELKVDFPYNNVAEIMKDKSIPISEKVILCDKLIEIRMNETKESLEQQPEVSERKEEMYKDEYEDLEWEEPEPVEEQDIQDAYEILAKKVRKTPKEMYITLCRKFPEKFKPNTSTKVGWERVHRNRTYIPTLITVDPKEYEEYKEECFGNKDIKHLADSYYVKKMDARIYFVRTSEIK